MTRTVLELRTALQHLADQAATVEDLDHRPWSYATDSAPRTQRRRPTGRLLAIAASTGAVLIALGVLGVTVFNQDHSSTPSGHGQAVLEVRPLLAPAVPLASSGPRSPDPLSGLPFEIPNTAAAYDRLSTTQRQQLLAALAHTDCAAQEGSQAPTRVACNRPIDGEQTAFLLGPSIFGKPHLTRAEALAPDAGVGNLHWTVAITLDSQATRAWSSYTTAHHTNQTSSVGPTQCATGSIPCADFVAFLINGDVLSVPVTLAPLGSSTQITGNFDEQAATTLAHDLAP
jgi:hypothetical protein